MKIAFPDDFSDRLSPMLVKELRQGLRTKAFIGVFLALQIILGIILLGAVSTSSSDQAGDTISNIIFIFFSIAVLVIQPMRGMGALSSEIKDNTIDMMVLTRLSAWRIVAGKWSAIVSQSALILVTIIPYLILRYFFGGMNLIGEVVMLFLIFITSAALTAITVSLSASTSVILRSILPLIGIPFGTYALFAVLMFSRIGGGGGSFVDYCSLETTESSIGVSLFLAACIYYSFFMLSIGTSLIAPYAENYSTFRRIIALVVTIAATIIGSIYVDQIVIMIAVYFAIFAPIFTISLTEFGAIVPPVIAKFNRYGFIGKFLGIFLLPTWATGVFFCYLITIIACISMFFIPYSHHDVKELIIGMGMISSMIFPAILINIFKNNGPARVSNYILFTVATGVISLTLLGVSGSLPGSILWFFVWLPPVAMLMTEHGGSDDDMLFYATAIFNVIYFVIFTCMAVRNFRRSINEINHSGS
jgi:hypothetical protein